MKIISTDYSGSFIIKDESKNLLVVDYMENDLEVIKTNLNGITIEIAPIHHQPGSFTIYKNGADRGEISFKTNEDVILKLDSKIGNSKEWLIKNKRKVFYVYYELINEEKKPILGLGASPGVQWLGTKMKYPLKIIDDKVAKNDLVEFLLYQCFIVNLVSLKKE
ncbi:MAG: hypothetical protein KUG68_06955 [Flavobacteriaceae bacterium]|nr:hypothetical protein [Flavobacteriaceae bacterium]